MWLPEEFASENPSVVYFRYAYLFFLALVGVILTLELTQKIVRICGKTSGNGTLSVHWFGLLPLKMLIIHYNEGV